MRRYELAKQIFLRALDVPEAERAAFVSRETFGDLDLRREVEELLAFSLESRPGGEAMFALTEEPPEQIGPWRIESELGRGGIGVVYLARRGEGPAVALKVLRPGLLTPDLVARLRREARVLARLDHPGIARALETGVDEAPSGPRPWIAMERIEGSTLRAWAAGDHPQAERLELMARVCDAVQHAHENGVVHRDLKPENILVRPDGTPVVLDFGVARLVDSDLRATTLLTTVGVLVGTIRYMSPEQADARPDTIGPRSDVHQLASLTYELVTGRLPYDVPEDSVHRALVAVLTSPPRPMDGLPPRLRRPLERVLRAALAKNPERRLASAALLADDLRRVAAGRPPHARPVREGGPDWRRLAGAALATAAAGVALAWLAGAIGPPPSPLDRVTGRVQPQRMYRRIMVEADSALVRLHYNTRTPPRLREARERLVRALALLETVAGRPWYREVRTYLRFRLGEAEYLIAERTYDADLYAKAAGTWYSAREVPPVAPLVALPDTLGPAAAHVLAGFGGAPWGAAAMAWDDRGRLADPVDSRARALAVRREGVALLLPGARGDSLPEPAAGAASGERLSLAGWLQGLGASHSHLGYDRNDRAEVEAAVPLLQRAAATREAMADVAGYASILHDLGSAFLRLSALGGDAAPLDSAIARLETARRMRADLPGYTSVVHSSCALARAWRLAAWRAADEGERRRDLGRALALLHPPDDENVTLAEADQALLALTSAEVLVDQACVERDSARLDDATRLLAEAEQALPRERAPVLAVQADLQRLRIEAQRFALTGASVHRERIRQLQDRIGMNTHGSTPRTEFVRTSGRRSIEDGANQRFVLEYPLAIPF